MTFPLLFGAIAALALSGVVRRFDVPLMLLGAVLGLGAVGASFAAEVVPTLDLGWTLPVGRFRVAVDALSAVFLVPVFVVPALGSVYGRGYWTGPTAPRLRLFFGFLAAAMALIVVARDGVLFLLAWEAMALSAFVLVTTEREDAAANRAGWVYLVATHLGTMCLLGLFILMAKSTGSFALGPVKSGPVTAMAVLALIGFGLKAGLMPLHVWLPGAHANAPSHVSAVMSGVVLKMGVYGLVRMAGLLPAPPLSWGAVMLAVGAVTGVGGIAYAVGQRDLKRLLAYSSIENIGIIALGLGLALVGRASARPDLVALGLGGALLHVWNHALFKPLLFLGAGAVLHATGTRQMDRLGGLAKLMPRTAGAFLVGAVAISGLPPLNGFMSELLLYLGLFRTVETPVAWAAVAAPVLATIGALAVATLVKLYGTVFMGTPRTEVHAHEPPRSMLGPMAVLACACLALGLAATAVLPLLDLAIREWAPAEWAPGMHAPPLRSLAPLGTVGLVLLVLLAGVGALTWLLRRRLAREPAAAAGTWDCGFAAPTARMQYTGSSFGDLLVRLLAWIVWPRRRRPEVRGVLPGRTEAETDVPDVVLDRTVVPALGALGRALTTIRLLQQGKSQLYVLYVLVAAIVLLVWR